LKSNNTINNSKIEVKKTENATYQIYPSRYHRFDRKNTVMNRVTWDSAWKGYQKNSSELLHQLIRSGKKGYSRIDFALRYASGIVYSSYKGGMSRNRIKKYRRSRTTRRIDLPTTKYIFEKVQESKNLIERVARFFGASLVGTCKLNRYWIYQKAKIPREFKNAIVMAVAMDSQGIATSPAVAAGSVTGLGYSKMAFILAGVGEFIRNLGYQAIQCGNDTVLSIPLAIDAGLGEQGRNGLLITPEYGPRVRLCTILTDLPTVLDKPIEFGVQAFCKKCTRCSAHCEANAISSEKNPGETGFSISNNPGVTKWYIDAEKCYLYWCKNGTDCSTCIKVCPYNLKHNGQRQSTTKEFWSSLDERTL